MKFHRSILPIALVSLFTSCSQQGEGERCVRTNKDGDCASGLICKAAKDLIEYDSSPDFAADRCCPEKNWSDPRCDLSTGTPVNSGVGVAGAAGSSANASAGASTAGQGGNAGSNAGGSGNDSAGAAGASDVSGAVAGAAGNPS